MYVMFKRKIISILAIVFFLYFFIGSVSAYCTNCDGQLLLINSIELKSDSMSSYDIDGYGEDGDYVDLRTVVEMDNSASGDYLEGFVFVEVFGVKGSVTETVKITEDNLFFIHDGEEKTIVFNDLFRIDDRYDTYKIIVNSGMEEEYIDNYDLVELSVGGNSGEFCDDIAITTATTNINELSTRVVEFKIYNYSNKDFYLTNAIADSGNKFIANVVGKDNIISANSNGIIRVRIEALEVTRNTNDSGTLRISGYFKDGATCGNNDIDNTLFKVTIIDDSSNLTCDNIMVFVEAEQTIKENTNEYFDFEIRNDSSQKFYINNIRISESSSYVSIDNVDFESFISGYGSSIVEYEIKSTSVSRNKNTPIYFEVEGEFYDGTYCSYSDIIKESTNLVIKDSSSSGYCGDIDVENVSIEIEKDETEIFYINVKNNSNDGFYLQNVYINSDSGVNVSVIEKPSYISRNSSKDIKLEIKGLVAGTKNVYVGIRGEFSNDSYCGANEIDDGRIIVDIVDGSSSNNAYCNDIEVNTNSVFLDEDETKVVGFYLQNFSNRKFYVDKVDAFDYSSLIDSEAYSWPDSVESQDREDFFIEIEALNRGNASGFVEVRGHFNNGITCSFSDIGREEYDVFVDYASNGNDGNDNGNDGDSGSGQVNCNALTLNVPNEIEVIGDSFFDVSVNNTFNQSVVVNIASANINVNPGSLTFPANSYSTKTINVMPTNLQGVVNFSLTTSCGTINKATIVSLSAIPIKEFLDVDYDYSVSGNKIYLSLNLKNLKNYLVVGDIGFVVPENWSVVGERNFILNKFSEEKIEYVFSSPGPILSNQEIELVLNANNQKLTKILLIDYDKNLLTGLFNQNNLLVGGFIILCILLLIVIFSMSRKDNTKHGIWTKRYSNNGFIIHNSSENKVTGSDARVINSNENLEKTKMVSEKEKSNSNNSNISTVNTKTSIHNIKTTDYNTKAINENPQNNNPNSISNNAFENNYKSDSMKFNDDSLKFNDNSMNFEDYSNQNSDYAFENTKIFDIKREIEKK